MFHKGENKKKYISNWPGAARPGRAVLFFVNKEKNQKKDFLPALRAKPFGAYGC